MCTFSSSPPWQLEQQEAFRRDFCCTLQVSLRRHGGFAIRRSRADSQAWQAASSFFFPPFFNHRGGGKRQTGGKQEKQKVNETQKVDLTRRECGRLGREKVMDQKGKTMSLLLCSVCRRRENFQHRRVSKVGRQSSEPHYVKQRQLQLRLFIAVPP